MSQVSHDSLWIRQFGKIHGYNPDNIKKKTGDFTKEEYVDVATEGDQTDDKSILIDKDDIERYREIIGVRYCQAHKIEKKEIFFDKELSTRISNNNADKALNGNNTGDIEGNKDIYHKGLAVSRKNNSSDKKLKDFKNCVTNWRHVTPVIETNDNNALNKKDAQENKKKWFKRKLEKENSNQKKRTNVEICTKKKIWQKQKNGNRWTNDFSGSALKRTKPKFERKPKCFLHSVVFISLMFNVAGVSNATDSSGFSSALTSRMIATFLGYPSTCNLGAEVRPCTLTFTCWLRGGTRLRGCGGWLFSCCGSPEPSREGFENSIQSSDWKYKMSPPKLRQVPQRSVMPNNVFRRRADDSVSQMDCGLPSSRILQKRIIGGREARFAEFPWQAHVRISEFQCGGVLVSRRYVATAAHCVSRAHVRDIVVWLGAVDTSATHHPARKLGVVQKILHPLFQFRMTQPDRYDIALLKLSRPITYMSHILPICLPDYDTDLRGRSGVIAGWGKTDASNSHTGTNMLRSATVPILSKEQCINWHRSKQISVEIHSEMICAGHSDGHQDACLGDSGGPLIVLENGRYYLVGITSAGFGCGVDHQPGIYHNVKLTANWIRGVISPSVNYIDV